MVDYLVGNEGFDCNLGFGLGFVGCFGGSLFGILLVGGSFGILVVLADPVGPVGYLGIGCCCSSFGSCCIVDPVGYRIGFDVGHNFVQIVDLVGFDTGFAAFVAVVDKQAFAAGKIVAVVPQDTGGTVGKP